MNNILYEWPFKFHLFKNIWKMQFARFYYEGESFNIRFDQKNFEKILDYLREWHKRINHDDWYVCSMKQRVKKNNLLFYR